MALPSPRPPVPRRSAAGCPARTGPGCRRASTPRTRSAGRRSPSTSSRRTGSNRWKSCSASGGSWPARTACRWAPRCELWHPRSRRPHRPAARRPCPSPPVAKCPALEGAHPSGSRCQNTSNLAISRPPGSRSTEPPAIPALARSGRARLFIHTLIWKLIITHWRYRKQSHGHMLRERKRERDDLFVPDWCSARWSLVLPSGAKAHRSVPSSL